MATAYDDDYSTDDDPDTDDDSNTYDGNLETFGLVWLDAAVHTSKENREAQQEIRSSINHVTPFEDSDSCQKYIRSVSVQDRIVLIVSGALGQEVVPRIHQTRQLSSIYVYCMNKEKHEKWANNYTKIKAVTVRLNDLISCIKADQKKRVKLEDPIVINIFMASKNPDQSTTGLNGQFVHSLLLIDVLLRMESVQTDKRELIELCKKEYKDNKTQLNILHDFEQNYSSKDALWWYTRESFLYKMLNKALRVQNIDVLFLLRFFIRDIHRALERNQCKSSTHVYRGQVLSNDELDNLRKSVGEFITINSFFSTTTNRHQALAFLNSSDVSNDLNRILFKIDADPRVVTTKPFADISSHSEFVDELEVLFMVGSIFRLESVHQNKDQIWIIRLTLCGDDEHDLISLFEHMKNTCGGDDTATLLTFGRVLRKMGKFDLAEKFYRRLLNELSPTDPLVFELYYSLGLVLRDKDDLDSSLKYLHMSLEMESQISPDDYMSIVDRYNAIGTVYRKKDQQNVALSWYQKGIDLLKQNNCANGLKIGHLYNNMANIYKNQEKYTQALDYNKKALKIRRHLLPSHHPDIGLSHNNIGNVYHCLEQYNLALKHHNQGLEIRLKSLPHGHQQIIQSYRNIGLVHEDIGDLKQALTFLQKAVAILQQSLPAQHPDAHKIQEDIRRVSSKLK